MAIVISFIGQKGGVGKSALARTLAYEASKSGLKVQLADLNLKQATSLNWHLNRLQKGLDPVGSVEAKKDVQHALQDQDNHDLIILDTPGETDLSTEKIARNSDIVILPTNTGSDDLSPTIQLAQLLEKKLDAEIKICLAFTLTMSEGETERAKAFAVKKGLSVLDGHIRAKSSYRTALSNGRALTETGYETLDNEAETLIQSIANLIS